MQVVALPAGSVSQITSYLEYCICHILKLRGVLDDDCFQSANVFNMSVFKISSTTLLHYTYINDVITYIKGAINERNLSDLQLCIHDKLTEALLEVWSFNIGYSSVDDESIEPSSLLKIEQEISASLRDMELKIQLAMSPFDNKCLTYDILFQTSNTESIPHFLEVTLPINTTPNTPDNTTTLSCVSTAYHNVEYSCFNYINKN